MEALSSKNQLLSAEESDDIAEEVETTTNSEISTTGSFTVKGLRSVGDYYVFVIDVQPPLEVMETAARVEAGILCKLRSLLSDKMAIQ